MELDEKVTMRDATTVAERAKLFAKRAAAAKVAAAGVDAGAIKDYFLLIYFKRHFTLTFHPAFNYTFHLILRFVTVDYNSSP